MNTFKKALAGATIAAVLGAAPTAQAASVAVDVDISLPNMLILYAYNDIDLSITAGELAGLYTTCSSVDPAVGCAVEETTTTGAIVSGAVDLDIGSVVAATNTTATVRLNRSWGVRGMGFTSYDESIVLDSGDGVTAVAIEDIVTAPSMTLTTGYVDLTLDLDNLDGDNDGFTEADYTITVVGS